MFLDKSGSIQRLTETSDSDKETYADVDELQGFPINVQPANSETVALSGGIFGKTYTVFTPRAGIKDGDRLTVLDTWIDGVTQNKVLQVMGVGNWSFAPLPHFEITCAEIKQ